MDIDKDNNEYSNWDDCNIEFWERYEGGEPDIEIWEGSDSQIRETEIESLETEIAKLKEENEKIMNELLKERNNVYDWKEKYKELKK